MQTRQLKPQTVKLQFWPLTGPMKITGFLDASYRNSEDGSSQRGMKMFSAELREHSSKDGMSYGSLVGYESQKDQSEEPYFQQPLQNCIHS